MIIYQILCTVPTSRAKEWQDWMLDEHIGDVMNTEMFTEYRLCSVLKPEETDTTQYCIQYYAASIDAYQRYRQDFAPVLQAAHKAKYGDEITIQRMVMNTLGSG